MKPTAASEFTQDDLEKLVARVPEFLRVSDSLAQEIHDEQEELSEKLLSRFTRPNQAEVELHISNEYEQMARDFFTAVSTGAPATSEEISFQKRRLAHSLQAQGRYMEAIASMTPAEGEAEESLLQELLDEVEAISISNDAFCSCVTPGPFPTTHIVKHVRVDGMLVPLIRCVICGHLNATETLPEDLAKFETIRNTHARKADSKLFPR